MSTTTPTSRSAADTRRDIVTPILLLIILATALGLRLYNNNWDDYLHAHPDERWIVMVAGDMHLPQHLSEALDPRRSPFNPLWSRQDGSVRHFAYGHLPLYLLTIVAAGLHALGGVLQDAGAAGGAVNWLLAANTYDGFNLAGRALSALFDTGTVYLIFLIGRRVYDKRAALLGAALSALTVSQIQLSHFYAFDPVATFFIVGAVYGGILMAQDGSLRAAVLAGAAAGAAISSKFSALPILAVLVVGAAARLWVLRRRQQQVALPAAPLDPYQAGPSSPLSTVIGLALISLSVAVIVFAVTSPFAIIDWQSFKVSVIDEQGAMVRGDVDFPYTRQYRGTIPFVYQIEQQLRWGMGWPLGILAFVGLAWVILRALLGRARPAEWIMLTWCIPYFVLTGLFMVKFMRYMLPLLPFFSLMGAALLERIWRRESWIEVYRQEVAEPETAWMARADREIVEVRQRVGTRPWWAWSAPAVALIVLASTAVWAAAFVNGVYGHEHTWITASKWIYQNVPDGSVLAGEHWDDTLPKDLQSPPGSFRGAHNYTVTDIPNYEEDTAAKFEILKQMLDQADYVVLATNRLYRSIPRLPQRYPMTTRYYQLLFDGQLGFEQVAEFSSRPRIGPLVFNDDNADESFTVYDHPKPIIFKKVRQLSDAEWQQLLGGTWEGAIPGYTGGKSLLSTIFDRLGGGGDTGPSGDVGGGNPTKTLLLSQPDETLPAPYDLRWNTLASNSTPLAVITWWLALLLVQVLAWPLTFVVLRHLRDRGYILARLVGWLVIGWLVWIVASLHLPVVGNNILTIGLAMIGLGLLSLWLWRRNSLEMSAFWKANRGLILVSEAVFAVAFLAFVGIRMLDPDLWQPWQGGEKFMEFAFLNATTRSTWMPPYDPYYAGGIINYYYYGYFLVGIFIKLTGITPSVAFNLAVPTLFAATVAGAFSLVYNLSPARGSPSANGVPFWAQGIGAGLTGSLFVAVIGNLDSMGQLIRRLNEQSSSQFSSQIPGLQSLVRGVSGLQHLLTTGGRLPGFDWWAPSRVLPNTINEFPYWSYLFADLHPHMIGIPFTILFLALALNLIAGYGAGMGRGRVESGLALLLIPLSLGALAVTNTWDLPTYLGVIVLAFMIRDFRATRRWRLWLDVLVAVVVGGLALGMYWPFFQHYAAVGSSGVGLVQGQTKLDLWLYIWGFFLFLAVTFLLVDVRTRLTRHDPARSRSPGAVRWLRMAVDRWDVTPRLAGLHGALVTHDTAGYQVARAAIIIGYLLAVLLALLGYWVPAVLLPPLIAAAVLLWRREASAERTFVVLLIFSGLLVLFGVEFVFLKDFLCGCGPGSTQVGDYYRMNTIFKFYIQAWVLLALGTAAGLPILWDAVNQRFHMGWRLLWNAAFVALMVSVLVFPVLGTPMRVDDRFPGARPAIGTLDGMAFMTVGTYTWPDPSNPIELKYDYEAIQWLLQNVRGNPVVAEGRIDYYREGGMRVSSFTGLPTLLGAHQSEQRYGSQVGQRDAEAREFFTTSDVARTQALIDELHIRYIYIGRLERTVYPADGLAKFDQMAQAGMLSVPYRNEQVTIYQVPA